MRNPFLDEGEKVLPKLPDCEGLDYCCSMLGGGRGGALIRENLPLTHRRLLCHDIYDILGPAVTGPPVEDLTAVIF